MKRREYHGHNPGMVDGSVGLVGGWGDESAHTPHRLPGSLGGDGWVGDDLVGHRGSHRVEMDGLVGMVDSRHRMDVMDDSGGLGGMAGSHHQMDGLVGMGDNRRLDEWVDESGVELGDELGVGSVAAVDELDGSHHLGVVADRDRCGRLA